MQSKSDQTHITIATKQSFTSYRLLIIGVLSLFLFYWSACSTNDNAPHTSPASSTPISPTSSPTLTATSESYENTSVYYFELVVKHKYLKAYTVLSPTAKSHEPYSDFVVNNNYTLLPQGCWKFIQIVYSHQEADGQRWNVGVELSYCQRQQTFDPFRQLEMDPPESRFPCCYC